MPTTPGYYWHKQGKREELVEIREAGDDTHGVPFLTSGGTSHNVCDHTKYDNPWHQTPYTKERYALVMWSWSGYPRLCISYLSEYYRGKWSDEPALPITAPRPRDGDILRAPIREYKLSIEESEKKLAEMVEMLDAVQTKRGKISFSKYCTAKALGQEIQFRKTMQIENGAMLVPYKKWS